MAVLVRLPGALIESIATEWITTNEFAVLDTACCNLKLRNQLLDEIKQFQPIADVTLRAGRDRRKLSVTLYRWIFAREIKLMYYDIYDNHLNDGKLIYKINANFVTFLFIDTFTDSSDIINLINNCPKLKKLNTFDCHISYISNIILAQLQDITVMSYNVIYSIPCLEAIIHNCVNLKGFKRLFSRKETGTEEYISKIIKQNPTLTNVLISGSTALLEYIIDNYSTMNLNFSFIDLPSVALLSKLILKETFSVDIQDVDFRNSITIDRIKNSLTIDMEFLSDIEVAQLITCGKSLQAILINNNSTSRIIRSITEKNSQSLTRLSLNLDPSTEMNILRELLQECRELKELTLKRVNSNIGDAFDNLLQNSLLDMKFGVFGPPCDFRLSIILTIIKSCPHLQSFSFHVVHVMDMTIKDFEREVRRHKHIKHLEVSYFNENKVQHLKFDGEKFSI